MKLNLKIILALAAVGCACLLGYVKSQWPSPVFESTIPGGKLNRALWDDGTRTTIITGTNFWWVDELHFTSNGFSGKKFQPPNVIVVNTNRQAFVTDFTNAHNLVTDGGSIYFAAGYYECFPMGESGVVNKYINLYGR